MKGQTLISGLLVGMVSAIVFAAILFPIVLDTYDSTAFTNQSFEATNETVINLTLQDDRILATSYTVYNTTQQIITLVDGTDYTLSLGSGGTTTILMHSETTAGDTNVNRSIDYTGIDDTFIDNGTTRTLFTFMPLLIAVAVLMLFTGMLKMRE